MNITYQNNSKLKERWLDIVKFRMLNAHIQLNYPL